MHRAPSRLSKISSFSSLSRGLPLTLWIKAFCCGLPGPRAPTPSRTFAGNARIDLAYSAGLGVTFQLTPPGKHQVMLDLASRHYDFGTAKGSSQVLGGAGGTPREALNVRRRDCVCSLSLRVPLKRS